jgi:hypothetical protein
MFLVTAVTTFWATVLSVTAPALVPLLAASVILSVTPAGIGELMLAVIAKWPEGGLEASVYVVEALLMAVGAAPATAADTFIWAGEPDTLICARASLAPSAIPATATVRQKRRTVLAVAIMSSDSAGDGVGNNARRRTNDAGRCGRIELVGQTERCGVELRDAGNNVHCDRSKRREAGAGGACRSGKVRG